jgi:hypothetical protein
MSSKGNILGGNLVCVSKLRRLERVVEDLGLVF